MKTVRTIHNVQQGSAAWLALRAGFFTASEAPAMMGVSKYTSRAALLRQKATGVAEEVDGAKQALFDRGHQAEAAARPLAEAIVEADLYPVTATIEVDGLRLLASLDGLDMVEDTAWETKLWNEALAADVRAGTLAPHYTVQMDQEILVSGASRCLFTCTDGTPERTVYCWYESSPEKAAAIIAGWHQFDADLAAFVPPAPEPAAAVGHAPETLPALRIEITGAVTASNLAEFKQTALTAIRSVNRELTTDQHFADAAKAVQWCTDVEVRLAAAKEHALSQTATIDALFKTIDDISAEAREVRLALDKLVTQRKTEIKVAIITKAQQAWEKHVDELEREVAPLKMLFAKLPDFATAAKGKRTVATTQDAIDTELANCKIGADATARDWRAKLVWYHEEAADYTFLFADLALLVRKPAEDFRLAVTTRIADHKAAEAKKQAQADDAARLTAQTIATAAAPSAPAPALVFTAHDGGIGTPALTLPPGARVNALLELSSPAPAPAAPPWEAADPNLVTMLDALLAHIDKAFDSKFPSHPKPSPEWWAELLRQSSALREATAD